MVCEQNCPDCGEPLRLNGRKCSCGWTLPGTRPQAVDSMRCAWLSNGQQCRYIGTCSHSTLGQGPWYCAAHSRSDQVSGQGVVEESQSFFVPSYAAADLFEATREAFLTKPLPPIPENRIKAQGIAHMRPVAEIVRSHMREPGSDDE